MNISLSYSRALESQILEATCAWGAVPRLSGRGKKHALQRVRVIPVRDGLLDVWYACQLAVWWSAAARNARRRPKKAKKAMEAQ